MCQVYNYPNKNVWRCGRLSVVLAFLAIVSWYGVQDGFHGQLTASGEVFNAYDYTAACHPDFLGDWLIVKNLENNLAVLVRCNDTGPWYWDNGWKHKGYGYVDLAQGAFETLAPLSKGIIKVQVELVRVGDILGDK